ncbi:MAG: hypothetical protein CVT62_00420 [Actinobacteria bacterium HGW-Actinobacteria-2]|nr:MAG: hypothetical protein CVT62_00420 [Actinobacteria bacterium HGW-Actinobacteria-2]
MDPTQWNAPFPVIVAALFVIVMARANATFWLGRLGSAGVRRTRLARLMDSPGYVNATERIDAYGAPVITLSFLTIGFQTLANLAAGATGMKLRHYLPAVAIGGLCWALLYATIGTVGVDLFGKLYAYSPVLAIGSGVLVSGSIATYVVWQFRRRVDHQDSPQEAPQDSPAA